jgi:WD40 repeat protein
MDASSSSSDRDPLERLADEFVARCRAGEKPSPAEYAERFPQWAEQILELFPALALVEGLKPGSGDRTGSWRERAEAAGMPRLERLGDYRILREIGHGGMGVVYEAIQESLGRRVALKILPLHGRIDPVQMERFQLESRSAARLHHSGIVPVYGVGEHNGVHYYVMQYIQGHGLDVILDDLRRLRSGGAISLSADGAAHDTGSIAVARSLVTGRFGVSRSDRNASNSAAILHADESSPHNTAAAAPADASVIVSTLSQPTESGYYRAVARLGVQVAQALAHAHGKGVLHRDIKPSNLLLDVDGRVWVTDFGLAKLEGSDGPTETGDLVGTFRYMAPERFEGFSDRRSDLYGLGMTLYELLTLRPAFEAATRMKVIEQVRHDPPLAPRKVDPRVPRDLETIVLKAIAKEPTGRYATAEALSSDLKNFIVGKPIVARRTGTAERIVKWAKRRPAIAALVLLLNVVAALGLSGILWQWRQTVSAYRVLDRVNSKLDETNTSLELNLYYSTIRVANSELDHQNLERVQELLANCPKSLRDWEYDYLARASHSVSSEISGFGSQLFGVAFSHDGPRLATASGDVRVWDTTSFERLKGPEGLNGSVVSVAFSPDGKRLAAGVYNPGKPGSIWIGNAETGAMELAIPAHVGIIWSIAFSPKGEFLASAGEDRSVLIWNTETGEPISSQLQMHESHHFTSVAFSPDGRYLAAGTGTRYEHDYDNKRGEIKIWETSTWKEVRTLKSHTLSVNSVAFSPDSQRLASGSSDRTVKIWDTKTWEAVSTLYGHTQFVVGVAFRPDNARQLVSASEDCTLKVWDVETLENLLTLNGHRGMVNCVAYSPDGRRIASGSDDLTLKLWNAEQPFVARTLGGAGRNWFTHVAFSPGGERMAAANVDRTLTIWDRSNYDKPRIIGEHNYPLWGLAFSRGDLIASACGDVIRADQPSEIRVWNWRTGELVRSLPSSANVQWSVAFSPDGLLMATAGGDLGWNPLELKVWDTTTWSVRHDLIGHARGVSCVAFDPKGEFLASGANDGIVKLWDVRSGEWKRDLDGGKTAVQGIAFSLDGKSLAIAGSESVTICNLLTNEKLALRGHLGRVQQVSFHPNGRRLASAGNDGTVRIWDLKTGQEVLTLRGHQGFVYDLAFSPDGHQLVSASRDGTVKIWDGTPWVELTGPTARLTQVNEKRGLE